MQSFDTTEGRHPFTVDGGDYYLEPFGFEEVVALAALDNVEDKNKQVDLYRAFIAQHARSVRHPWVVFLSGLKSPVKAVYSLQPVQLSKLFAAWSGGPVGESSGSESSAPVTDEN